MIERQVAKLKESTEYAFLTDNAKKAAELGIRKQKHSAFYYRLTELKEKIDVFKDMFYAKVPKHEEYH